MLAERTLRLGKYALVVPIIRNVRCDEGVHQYTGDESAGQDRSGNINCDSETSESLGNQPPVESDKRSFREIQSRIEEVDRHEDNLAS